MNEEQTGQEQQSPSDPPEDPKVNPKPPSNPDVDTESVERGEEQIEKISGN